MLLNFGLLSTNLLFLSYMHYYIFQFVLTPDSVLYIQWMLNITCTIISQTAHCTVSTRCKPVETSDDHLQGFSLRRTLGRNKLLICLQFLDPGHGSDECSPPLKSIRFCLLPRSPEYLPHLPLMSHQGYFQRLCWPLKTLTSAWYYFLFRASEQNGVFLFSRSVMALEIS